MQKQILHELHKREVRRKLIIGLSSLVAVFCFGYFGIYYYFNARTSMDYDIKPVFSSRTCWTNIKLYMKRIKS